MSAMGLGAALSIAAGSKVVEKLCNEIFDSGKDFFRDQKIKKINKHAFKTIYKKIQSVENVKTIWKVDDEVNLRQFYYPSTLHIPATNSKIKVDRVSDISERTNIVIEGTAGQGKSILLRYLASNEIKSGDRIPVFIELRRIRDNETIIDAIQKKLDSLGFIVTENTIDEFLKSGKLLLLLDGFDEISSKNTTSITEDIELLSEKHEETQIAITSRPGAGIQNSGAFRVVQTSPILPSDHYDFLLRICTSKLQAKNISEAIENSSSQIQLLLRTPLLLTLLAILYKSEESIPENLIDFYDKLFYILYTRHDSTKPGFKREIKSGLTERKFEEVFEAFCFLSRKSQKVSLSRREAIDFSEQSLSITKRDCDESDFINDCCKVACMLIEEGMEYHFIHKSVQEFYAARFISRRSDDFVVSFYEHALDHFPEWQQEINFLETLDKLRATRFFKIPAINKMKSIISEKGAEYILEGSVYRISNEHKIESLITSGTNTLTLYYSKGFLSHGRENPLVKLLTEHRNLPEEIGLEARKFPSKAHKRFKHKSLADDDIFLINAYDLINIMNKKELLDKIVDTALEALEADLRRANEILDDEDALRYLSF